MATVWDGGGGEAGLAQGGGPAAPTVWDAGGPEPALIDDCVHCGFCLPTCPTYALWGEEMDSPRGRIQLMALGHEQAELSEEMVGHVDNCLGCMACVTACPSGVQYDRLLEQTRPAIERQADRGLADRAFRRLVFETLPRPGRLRAMVPLLALSRRLGLERAIPARFDRLRAMAGMAPEVDVAAAWRRLPEVTPAVGEKRGTVALLQGCVQRVFFDRVNRAAVAVLAAEGFEVHAPRQPRCCGSLQLHTGYADEARACALEAEAAFAGYERVVVTAAGCGSGMKEYGPALGVAAELASRVCDVHELLASVEPRAARGPVPLRVAYHDACHLAHAQGIRSEPRDLLRGIPGLSLVEPEGWEICCGSAGVYNLLKPEAAGELGARKAASIEACRPEIIAAANPGCAVQIEKHLQRPVPIVHPIELLAQSIGAGAGVGAAGGAGVGAAGGAGVGAAGGGSTGAAPDRARHGEFSSE